MALNDYLRGLLGCATPTDDEGIANKAYVDQAIADAIAGLSGGGSGAGIVGVTPAEVTHSGAGDLALDMDDSADYVFNVDMSANVTGLDISNMPDGFSLVFIQCTNSSGSAKTIDITGETGVIPDDELVGVVSVAAGEAFGGSFQVWNLA